MVPEFILLFEGSPIVIKLYNRLYYKFGINKWLTLTVCDLLIIIMILIDADCILLNFI